MASLSSGLKLGTTSASALVKSAASLQSQINAYKDESAKINYDNSGHTDAAFQEYVGYLNGRISTLRTTGTVADQSKALTMSQEIITANHQNVSYQIQQENLGLMLSGDAGTSSGYKQKLQVLSDEFNRANSVGDNTLALELQNQYASTSQSLDAALQSEATAQQTIYNSNVAAEKAANKAVATGYTDARNAIHDSVVNLMANFKTPTESTSGKPMNVSQQLSEYVKNWGPTYKAVTGQDLPKGKQLTMGGLLEASFNAKFAYDITAAKSLGGSDPSAAEKFAKFDANGQVIGGDALNVLNNTDYYKVPGKGNLNFQEARNWAAVPNLYRVETKIVGGQSVTEFKQNAITDIKMINGEPMLVSNGEDKVAPLDKNTGVIGNAAQRVSGALGLQNSQQITQLLVKAGFGDVKFNKGDNTFTVKMTAQSDHWTQAHGQQSDLASANQLGAGNEITLHLVNGTLKAVTSGGRLVNLAFDTNNRAGIFQTMPNGQTTHITGQYGFNQHQNTFIANASISSLRERIGKQSLNNPAANNFIHNLGSGKPLPGSFLAMHPQNAPAPPARGPAPPHAGPAVNMAQRAGGGFNFTQNGQSISAAKYAQLTNTPFRTLLQNMANKGDAGARSALAFVGNDFGYNPGKIGGNTGIYNALTWGVKPAAATAPTGIPGLRLK